MMARAACSVMAGLVPATRVLTASRKKTWMPGHRRAEATPSFGRLCPGMTALKGLRAKSPFLQLLATASSRHRLFDQFLGGFRQQLVGCFAINLLAADFQHDGHRERRNAVQ